MKTSASRLPADHFISGALFGAISSAAIEYNKDISVSSKAKNITKIAICGGVAASCSISASNNIILKNYFGAAQDIALGVGLIAITQYIFKEKK